jgi:PncC family amidohydrolase
VAATDLVARLVSAGLTVATAESLTGGMLGALITGVPGSSVAYRGGVVAYATEVKQQLLGVPADLVATHGVVSRECAEAMATGVRGLLGASYGVATTGVAGPGPQDGHGAGTVWVAVAGEEGVDARLLALPGSRDDVRRGTCAAVIELLEDVLPREVPGLG